MVTGGYQHEPTVPTQGNRIVCPLLFEAGQRQQPTRRKLRTRSMAKPFQSQPKTELTTDNTDFLVRAVKSVPSVESAVSFLRDTCKCMVALR